MADNKEDIPVRTEEDQREIARHDLRFQMLPFLDAHLAMAMVADAKKMGVYNLEAVNKCLLSLARSTNNIDAVIEYEYGSKQAFKAEATESAKDEYEKQLHDIKSEFSRIQNIAMPILQVWETDALLKKIVGNKSTTLEDLLVELEVKPEVLPYMFQFAKALYDFGKYVDCRDLLKHARSMPQPSEATPESTASMVSCLWGGMASSILADPKRIDFQALSEIVFKLDDYYDSASLPKKVLLKQRAWLLHWSLWVIFGPKTEEADLKVLDFFLNEKNLSTISLMCPHLLRYVGACLILQKRLKHLLKDSVWILHHEAENYTDPVTRFLLALYTDLDFDEAQRELQQCRNVCESDFFLRNKWYELEESARLLVFEAYCRIHQCINITMLSSKLNMTPEEAELWIVNLIRNAKLDARIDSEKSRVVMSKASTNVYQQVVETTKNLSFRSTMLLANLDKRESELAQAVVV